MQIERMIELLKIEHECMLRKSHDDCNSNCADCDLVQDDLELDEMYTCVIDILQKKIKPYESRAKLPCTCVRKKLETWSGWKDGHPTYSVKCPNCGRWGESQKSELEASRAWNKMISEATVVEK